MRKDGSKQKTKEIQFSLEAVEAKKISLVGGFNNGNPDADCVFHTRGDEPSDFQVFMQMVPCSLHAYRDEPNSFHF
jgi:hypothetical protein